MAKELCMMSKVAKGKQARQYFIECEKKLKSQASTPKELSRKELALIVIAIEEEKEALAAKLIDQQPKVEYVDKVLESKSCLNTTQIAKELGMSAISLNKKLSEKKVIYKTGGTWVPSVQYQDMGYTQTKTALFVDSEGNQRTSMLTVWTEKGRMFIHSLFA